jgi:cell division septation protein DedD
MTWTATGKRAALLPLLCGLAFELAAQETESGCAPDEIDMGDYCVKKAPEALKLQPGAKRATPFRVKSMMPGRVGEQPLLPGSQPAPEVQAEPAAAPSIEASGYGVQLGLFSTREKAREVARDVAAVVGGPFALAPIELNERILWACINGPFPDKPAAIDAQRRLRQETPFRDAFVKPLDELELLDPEYATAEK